MRIIWSGGRLELAFTLIPVAAVVGLLGIIPVQALAVISTPYDAGSQHAYKDCLAGSQKYLSSQGKGPDFHTPQFNQGYLDTWNECHSQAP